MTAAQLPDITLCIQCQRDGVSEPRKAIYKRYEPQCKRHYEKVRRLMKECEFPSCTVKLDKHQRQSRGRYCRAHEYRYLQSDEKRPKTVRRALDRVAANVTPDWETGCWKWTGRVTADRSEEKTYGLIRVGVDSKRRGGTGNGQEWSVHRFMYVYFYGGHPPGLTLDHLCGDSLCANPSHLAALTKKDHQRITARRQRNPEVPWYLHANQSEVSNALIAYIAAKGLPLRPGDDFWTPADRERLENQAATGELVQVMLVPQ